MDLNEADYVLRSKIRLNLLISLKSEPKTPTQISKEISAHITHVSEALKQLETKGLLSCLNPNDKKNKSYYITEDGKNLLNAISKATKVVEIKDMKKHMLNFQSDNYKEKVEVVKNFVEKNFDVGILDFINQNDWKENS